jgi:adenylate cyclase
MLRSDDPPRDVERAWKLGREAEATENKPRLLAWLVHWLMASLYQWHENDFDRSVPEAEAAIRMVPYDARSRADLSEYLSRAGKADEAIAWATEAIRREAHVPAWYYWNLGLAYYIAGRPADTLAEVSKMNDRSWSQVLEAVAHVRLGHTEEARAAVTDYLKRNPGWTIRNEAVFPMKEPFKQAYLDDLRKAGMPE